jgi:amidohydrolase
MDLKERISKQAELVVNEIIEIRRHLHANPELSFEEFKTSGFVVSKLDEWGIAYRKGIAGTGIVADVEGAKPGKVIAFRADMDALPIQEQNDVPYRSTTEGKMHACGHDVHTASLLGAIKILTNLRNEFSGKIRFVFQPGEEKIPGGAKLMLEEGLFGNEEPELMIAQHVYPDMESGSTGFRPGVYMASSDEIYLRIIGKGGHAALPENLVDPVLISAQILTSLQQLVSRHAKPGLPTVLSFGKVVANGAVNVIPDEVRLEGTFRTMNEAWRRKAHKLMEQMVINTARALGGEAEIEIRHGYPVLQNDVALTGRAASLASEFLGSEKVHELDIRMTAEDFAYFSQRYPSCMFRLGVAKPGETCAPLHTSRFDVDETAIKHSIGLFSWLGIKLLSDHL